MFSDLAKTILQSTVNGIRRRGRLKKLKLGDNIKERTGMGLTSSARAAENRTRWKGIIKSSVVPQRPLMG